MSASGSHDSGADDVPSDHANPEQSEAADQLMPDGFLTDEVAEPLTEEDVEVLEVPDTVDVLDTVTAERDGYLDALQRLKAEFDNHRRRTAEDAVNQRAQAAASLVEKLLPVLDSCDAALAHDAEAVRPILDSLTDVLTDAGLERLDPEDDPFDPEYHDAVMHEDGDDDTGPVVAQVLRAGYTWNGRVLRPAMVKVRG